MHWAMDAGLIAPRLDYRWHIHKTLEDRVADLAHLVRLKDRELVLPKEARRLASACFQRAVEAHAQRGGSKGERRRGLRASVIW